MRVRVVLVVVQVVILLLLCVNYRKIADLRRAQVQIVTDWQDIHRRDLAVIRADHHMLDGYRESVKLLAVSDENCGEEKNCLKRRTEILLAAKILNLAAQRALNELHDARIPETKK